MRRREALAGLGALGVFGAGATVAFGSFDSSGSGVDPVELRRFDAPGSAPGTELVPAEGRVSFVSVFATWCPTCRSTMEPLGEAAAALDGDIQFVSVTNEAVGQTVQPEEVVEWWVTHGGSWPVAHDEDLELTRRLDAGSVPFSAVFDAGNRLTWAEPGYRDAGTILDRIDEAR